MLAVTVSLSLSFQGLAYLGAPFQMHPINQSLCIPRVDTFNLNNFIFMLGVTFHDVDDLVYGVCLDCKHISSAIQFVVYCYFEACHCRYPLFA
jgi:hypothetical protein